MAKLKKPKVLSMSKACLHWGVSKQTLGHWVKKGCPVTTMDVKGRKVRGYVIEEVDKWRDTLQFLTKQPIKTSVKPVSKSKRKPMVKPNSGQGEKNRKDEVKSSGNQDYLSLEANIRDFIVMDDNLDELIADGKNERNSALLGRCIELKQKNAQAKAKVTKDFLDIQKELKNLVGIDEALNFVKGMVGKFKQELRSLIKRYPRELLMLIASEGLIINDKEVNRIRKVVEDDLFKRVNGLLEKLSNYYKDISKEVSEDD